MLERIQENLLNCLQDMDDVLNYCLEILSNNNVIVLIEKPLYHQFKISYHHLSKVRDELYDQYLNLENKLSLAILDLTLEGYEWIEFINQLLMTVEDQWINGDINVNKYLLAQDILNLKLEDKVILDIDDLDLVSNSTNPWICVYIVQEGSLNICHSVAWKTKQEALTFALQMSGCRRDYVFNRFQPR